MEAVLLSNKLLVHRHSERCLPRSGHPDDGDNHLAAGTGNHLGHFLHRPVQADQAANVDEGRGQPGADRLEAAARLEAAESQAVEPLVQHNSALPQFPELAGVVTVDTAKPIVNPRAEGGTSTAADLDEVEEEVSPVLAVVGELAGAVDQGLSLGVGLMEGLVVVVDRGTYEGELVTEQAYIAVDAVGQPVQIRHRQQLLPQRVASPSRHSPAPASSRFGSVSVVVPPTEVGMD